MKKIIITIIILCGIGSSYAQQDLINDLKKQAITNDSLNKAIKSYEQSSNENQVKIENLQDTIKILKTDLSKLENFRDEKETIDKQLKLKSDSIALLKSNFIDKDKELKIQEQNFRQQISDARENSRKEIIKLVVDYYKNKPFDELIKSSTQQSILRDKQIIGNNRDIEPILSSLDTYSNIKNLFGSKYEAAKIKEAKNQLSQIKLESPSLYKLRNTVQNYQTFNEGLKEVIGKIMALDERELVLGMTKEIQDQKFNKILAEISYFIFNYDFNFVDYPYLSDVVLEIIKRKTPNPDTDISNLLQKL